MHRAVNTATAGSNPAYPALGARLIGRTVDSESINHGSNPWRPALPRRLIGRTLAFEAGYFGSNPNRAACVSIFYMPYKNKEDQRQSWKRHYESRKSMYVAKAKKRRNEIKEFIRNLKEQTPCTDCKLLYPYYVMDFDHLYKKAFNVSNMARVSGFLKVKSEIAKCELVCSNCHRIRTNQRRLASKQK